MKRSEAIKEIVAYFFNDKLDRMASIKAENMLEFFEKRLGMSPPPIDTVKTVAKRDYYGRERLEVFKDKKHVWEPESRGE